MKATCNWQCRALVTVGFVIGADKIRGLPAIGKDHARVGIYVASHSIPPELPKKNVYNARL